MIAMSPAPLALILAFYKASGASTSVADGFRLGGTVKDDIAMAMVVFTFYFFYFFVPRNLPIAIINYVQSFEASPFLIFQRSCAR